MHYSCIHHYLHLSSIPTIRGPLRFFMLLPHPTCLPQLLPLPTPSLSLCQPPSLSPFGSSIHPPPSIPAPSRPRHSYPPWWVEQGRASRNSGQGARPATISLLPLSNQGSRAGGSGAPACPVPRRQTSSLCHSSPWWSSSVRDQRRHFLPFPYSGGSGAPQRGAPSPSHSPTSTW